MHILCLLRIKGAHHLKKRGSAAIKRGATSVKSFASSIGLETVKTFIPHPLLLY